MSEWFNGVSSWLLYAFLPMKLGCIACVTKLFDKYADVFRILILVFVTSAHALGGKEKQRERHESNARYSDIDVVLYACNKVAVRVRFTPLSLNSHFAPV